MSNRSSRDEDTELLPLPRHDQGSDRFASEAIDHDALEEHSETHSEHQPLQDEAQSKQSKSRRGIDALFKGWKVTNFMSLVASVVVLFFNIGFLVFAVTQPLQGTGRVLYEGSYAKVRHLSTGLHLVINFLSTALLSASNFGMVFLSLLRLLTGYETELIFSTAMLVCPNQTEYRPSPQTRPLARYRSA